ncbi:MAG TPA: hypothetical protein VNA17_04805, partial [Pyrinomonadaceae bacterium]|nr:hypothetical protein [Pyrinomonadaceae bacterium]
METTVSKLRNFHVGFCVIAILMTAIAARSQTTTFTHQGRLPSPVSGNHDLEVKLYPVAAGGAPIVGQVVTGVPVTQGIFSVTVDFGLGVFSGDDRWIEVSYRRSGTLGGFIPTPRQQVYSVPYAIKSILSGEADFALDSAKLGGVDANQYVLTTDPRLGGGGGGPPAAGSPFYIHNSATQQASSNFNISGNGIVAGLFSAGTVNAQTQFNLGGQRILRSNAGSFNLALGEDSGSSAVGSLNTFVGNAAGRDNVGGLQNSFFGHRSGLSNTNGASNNFFGYLAGRANTVGSGNSFFGFHAGSFNTEGGGNSFFGNLAGADFFAGSGVTSGTFNTFVGHSSGGSIITGSRNSMLG